MRISDWSSDACSSDLKADLEKANSERDVRPWIIVGGHRPIYSVDNCDQTGIPSGTADRKSVVSGESVSVRVDLGGRRIIKQKQNTDSQRLESEHETTGQQVRRQGFT